MSCHPRFLTPNLSPFHPFGCLFLLKNPDAHLGGRCNFGNIFVKCSRAAQRLSLSAVTGDTGCCGWSSLVVVALPHVEMIGVSQYESYM